MTTATANREEEATFDLDFGDELAKSILESGFFPTKADDGDKAAQKARSAKYGIAIKEGGNVTKPGKWASVPDDEWGDPVNYKLPMPDAPHARNAASRVAQDGFRKSYTSSELSIIEGRVTNRKKALGVGDDDNKSTTPDTQKDTELDNDPTVWEYSDAESAKNADEVSSEPDNTAAEATSDVNDGTNPDSVEGNAEEEDDTTSEEDTTPTAEVDTTDDNIDEGTETLQIAASGSVETQKGSLVFLQKGEDGTWTVSVAENELKNLPDNGVLVGQVGEALSFGQDQFGILGCNTNASVDGRLYSRTISGNPLSFSVADSNTETGNCTFSWTNGEVKVSPLVMSPQESTKKEDTPKTTKGLSVAEQLWDTPVSWEFEDIFYAFLTCCYKLGVACEVNDTKASPAQYAALIEEMAALMKQCVGADADDDLADDMFAAFTDRFTTKAIMKKQLALYDFSPQRRDKAGAKISSETGEVLMHIHNDVKSLKPDVCGDGDEKTAALEARVSELETQNGELETKASTLETELKTANTNLEELQSEATRLAVAAKQTPVKMARNEAEKILNGDLSSVRAFQEVSNDELGDYFSEDEAMEHLYGV